MSMLGKRKSRDTFSLPVVTPKWLLWPRTFMPQGVNICQVALSRLLCFSIYHQEKNILLTNMIKSFNLPQNWKGFCHGLTFELIETEKRVLLALGTVHTCIFLKFFLAYTKTVCSAKELSKLLPAFTQKCFFELISF